MTKKIWISISIIAFLIGLMLILFGAVFCVRNQKVEFIGDRDRTLAITSEHIISTSNIEEGTATFFIDKQAIADKIERAYPYIKVINIETVSPTTLNYRLRERVPMYYARHNDRFIVLDEELKVLEVTSNQPNMTLLNVSDLGVTSNTKSGEFVGVSYADLTDALFTSMYNVAKIDGEYLDRAEIRSFMTEVSFDTGYTLTKHYTRLIIKTSMGVTLDIAEPDDKLEYKLNILMSALESDELTLEQKSSGRLKYYLTQDNEYKAGYFETGE